MNHESELNYYSISIGEAFTLSFQRTLRIPEDGRVYPLPPSLGAFPIFDSRRYPSAPESWRKAGDLFLPMYRREAMWIGLRGVGNDPRAVLIGLGNKNAVSGDDWTVSLMELPQNYLVCPPQAWLDGINAGTGTIRQFVAVMSGSGESIEAQLSSKPEAGGMRIAIFRPKPGFAPNAVTPAAGSGQAGFRSMIMGLGAGGTMNQKIYPDPYGAAIWEQEPECELRFHILESNTFRELTGQEPPPTLVSAEEYTKHGLPWFALYDEAEGTLPETGKMQGVRSLGELNSSRGDKPNTVPMEIPTKQIWKLKLN